MCGITGYIGPKDAFHVILDSLKKLEYRGYDSYGFATLHEKRIHIYKDVGKISNVNSGYLPGNIGIGHSRWATHGGVTKENAHPHLDCHGRVAVVHNGIIENYQELRDELTRKGHIFRSETDTEVIPHLIEENLNLGFVEAVKEAVKKLKGRYAIIALSPEHHGMIAVRKGSPLILGVKDGECYVASDIPAFLDHTNNVMYLDDNEMVIVTQNDLKFYNVITWEEVKKRIVTIEWSAEQAKKGEYAHYMIKEIMEQKDTLRRAINQDDNEIEKIAKSIAEACGTFFTGCGTAGKVAFTAEYAFSKIAKKHVNYIVASEFPNYHHFLTNETLLIAISQSGETADVIEAIETAKEKGVKIISIVNVVGSTIARMSDHVFYINAGPEKAVASTKATTAQLAVIYLLAYASAGKLQEGKKNLMDLASKVNDMLNPRYEERIKKLAEMIHAQPNIYIIGRSINYPMALESAIKIQEVSYIHAEGFAGGELKHGPIALIEKNTPCIALVANDEVKDDVISNAIEVKSRGGFIIGISPENNEVFDYWLKVPDVGVMSPIVNIIPVQILAYHLGLLRGCEIDTPRNLAKSVTVK
ncbi:MAG: glutamine--fructose-6-phosphate transaminase (isomerizing) [Candidatus Aenigmatarchaeota archaeon]|nr:MAG: glutamine--fructose-6-phosphate transaminase (isomerizing) [Candidatus Aenigmarchaeota archaeon]